MSTDPQSGEPPGDPRAAAVSALTTEHFTLQGARAATISESTGRATMFLSSVSGGLVALGSPPRPEWGPRSTLALVLVPPLAFVGLVTFDRALQSGIEDLGCARRIARLRSYYFQGGARARPVPAERLSVQGLGRDGFRAS